MLTGDIGRTAELARDDRLDEASLRAVPPAQVHARLAGRGRRRDHHAARRRRSGSRTSTTASAPSCTATATRSGSISRDLHDISGQFPEVVDGARRPAWDGILDGEMLAYRDGAVLPFIALQARLGRKAPSAAIRGRGPGHLRRLRRARRSAPADGRPVEPLLDACRSRSAAAGSRPRAAARRRRRRLRPVATSSASTSIDDLEAAFAGARGRRNEGLMVKDPPSGYSPGRRGLGWLKMKKALATIDCVVVGVEVGHGKRHGVLSDYTFAVRDDATDRLVTIGKAYSGLTDAEIAEMTALVRGAHDRAVRPLPGRRADGRRRGRVRRDHPLEPPQVGLRAALPADRRTCGRTRRPTRSTRVATSRRSVRGAPAGRRAPGDSGRQEVVPAERRGPGRDPTPGVSCRRCSTRSAPASHASC